MQLGFTTEEILAARQREEARTAQLARSLADILHQALRTDDAVASSEVITDDDGHPTLAVELIDGTAFVLPVQSA